MSNYNFDLDMNSDNSNSTILRNINPNSKVLEFGCAHGRMTKYLKEILQCEVHIVEQDYDDLKIASQWAEKSWHKKIEDFDTDEKYDYIIFADVLEHLIDPRQCLLESKFYLNDNGSIWISIPNVGHNSVLIDLLNNKFEYKEVGLLDKTHLRFFTEQSLSEMVESCALKINQKFNLINTVGNTEFNNSYDDVPDAVSDYLKSRLNGEVYQFVWELKL
jgi:2-polyprenyl-3-methyl-5-hydroxy-6-metoxy-1,4-benzoquinol methylase